MADEISRVLSGCGESLDEGCEAVLAFAFTWENSIPRLWRGAAIDQEPRRLRLHTSQSRDGGSRRRSSISSRLDGIRFVGGPRARPGADECTKEHRILCR